jgi:tripartite-type tricarboxylate transporter receptor subunit TctC
MRRAVLLVLALLCAPCLVLAQAYPSKPVKIIVPFAPGGPADIYARAIGEKLQAALGQSFVVENKPGGGAVIGTVEVAKSAPDGYTLLMMSNTHTVNESLLRDKPYQLLRDLVPVAPVNYSDLVMVVHPSVPAQNLAEFLALAKAKPGGLNYASSGPGTPYHMAGELFKAMANVDIVHVPYKGSSGARTDMLGGQVQMMFDAITTMAPHVQAGKLRRSAPRARRARRCCPRCPRSRRRVCRATRR